MAERRELGTFRHHLILTTALASAVFAALVGASIFLPLADALDRAEPGSVFSAAIAEHFLDLHRTFWPVVAGALIASVASAMLLYLRMVGPLVRFRQVYHAIASGAIPQELAIRRYDYLTAETNALNQLLAALRERAADRDAGVTRCGLLLDELEALELGPKERAQVAELRSALEDLR